MYENGSVHAENSLATYKSELLQSYEKLLQTLTLETNLVKQQELLLKVLEGSGPNQLTGV